MPKRIEEALKRRANQLGYEKGTERYKRYVYGTLEKIEQMKKGKDAERTPSGA